MNKMHGAAAEALAALTSQRGYATPPVSAVTRRAAIENQLYIYNVSPYTWVRSQGSLGTFIVPAKEQGEVVSKPCIVPGLIVEAVYIGAMGDGQFENREHDGVLVAMDIMGTGMHQAPDNALTRFGVFLAEGVEPTTDEVLRAERAFEKHDEETIAEADMEYSINNGMRTISLPDGSTKMVSALKSQHYEAAARRGIKRPWISANLGEMPAPIASLCPHCNAQYMGTPAFCPQGCVLDLERAKIARPHLFAQDEPRRGPGRPPNSERA